MKKALIIIGLLILAKVILWPLVSMIFAATFLLIKLAIVALLVIIIAGFLGIRTKTW